MKMAAGETALECSKLALQLAWAKVSGDTHASESLGEELKFSTCDPLWTECVEKYVFYLAKNKGSIPYRTGGNYILNVPLPETANVAIFGDWGTGTPLAIELLQQISRKKPDLIIYLGDIYYSGTKTEVQTSFLDICRSTLGDVQLVSLSGNHDMYSGGAGYYWLVDQLGQQASYFCIRNTNWQFLAMDTGYNDSNPFTVSSNVTSVTPSELTWHKSKISEGSKDNRRTVLLSHHQLYSANEAIGTGYINELLLRQFRDVLGKVDIWFWGHEHRLNIYAPYLGLQRGRCIGCSAVPVFVEPEFYKSKYGVPLIPVSKKSRQPFKLGNNGVIYNHAYAIMSLNGPSAQVSYFQNSDEDNPIYTESIT